MGVESTLHIERMDAQQLILREVLLASDSVLSDTLKSVLAGKAHFYNFQVGSIPEYVPPERRFQKGMFD